MKKSFFMLLPILALMASCEEKQPEAEVSNETTVTDSTETVIDTIVVEATTVDTVEVE